MATRALATVAKQPTIAWDKVDIVQWTGLLNGDDGGPAELPGYADRTVQVTGTFGAGGTIVIEGSVDGINYVTLTDPQGNALSKTAAFLEAISEAVRYIRPRVTAGDGTTSLVCTILFRKA